MVIIVNSSNVPRVLHCVNKVDLQLLMNLGVGTGIYTTSHRSVPTSFRSRLTSERPHRHPARHNTYIANQSGPSRFNCAGTLSGSSLQLDGVLAPRPVRTTEVGVEEVGPDFRLLLEDPTGDPTSSFA